MSYTIKTNIDMINNADNVLCKRTSKDNTMYAAKTRDSNNIYNIYFNKEMNSWSCSCPFFQHRNKTCKHIIAVMRKYIKNVEFDCGEDFKPGG